MRIDKKLNLVIPVYDEKDQAIWVHSTPIARETFEQHFRILSQTFTELYTGGLGSTAGPRVTAMMLRDNAKGQGIWDGPNGIEMTLFAEIYRLTNVLISTATGWTMLPLTEARKDGLISDEDFAEVENAICFFIVNSAMLRRAEAPTMISTAVRLWGAQTTSLGCTEYMNSLATSTKTESTGEKDGTVLDNPSVIPS